MHHKKENQAHKAKVASHRQNMKNAGYSHPSKRKAALEEATHKKHAKHLKEAGLDRKMEHSKKSHLKEAVLKKHGKQLGLR